MSSNLSGEGEIRKSIIEADLVDCMIALPGQLFYTTPIPVCLWFLTRSKANGKFRDRRQETLFIDARKMGTVVDRVHRDLSEQEILHISRTYHAWRGEINVGTYKDVPGFCMNAKAEGIAAQGYILTPGRYVGAEEVEDEGAPFDESFPHLVTRLKDQLLESDQLTKNILSNLKVFGYGR